MFILSNDKNQAFKLKRMDKLKNIVSLIIQKFLKVHLK